MQICTFFNTSWLETLGCVHKLAMKECEEMKSESGSKVLKETREPALGIMIDSKKLVPSEAFPEICLVLTRKKSFKDYTVFKICSLKVSFYMFNICKIFIKVFFSISFAISVV